MDHPDTAWCPVCDRNILPKRITVQVPVTSPAPAPTPSPTTTTPAEVAPTPAPAVTRTKSTSGRGRNGLVHGTGRAKAVRAASKTGAQSVSPAPAAAPAPTPAPVAMKTRTIIDQSPLPLYCSDECRMVDLHRLDGGFEYDFDPLCSAEAQSPPALSPCRPGSDVSDPESVPEPCLFPSITSLDHMASARTYAEMGPEIARIATQCNFPPLPPPMPLATQKPAPRAATLADYNGGIIMAGRRMKEVFAQPPLKKGMSPAERYTAELERKVRKPIPGWTDGSDAWREDMYSISPGKDWTVLDPHDKANRTSLAWTPAEDRPRSRADTAVTPAAAPRTSSMPPPTRSRPTPSSLAELYGPNYAMFDPSREAKRAALFPGPSSLPARSGFACSSSRKVEVPILPPAAKGKLLVPDVVFKRTPSASSIASTSSASGPLSPGNSRSRPVPRRQSSVSVAIPEDQELAMPPFPRPAASQERQYSADGWPLYEVVPWTEVKLCAEKRVINGVEVEVEVEKRVPRYVSSLFLGPDGRDPRYEARMAPRRAAERAAELAALAEKKAKQKARKAARTFPPPLPPLAILS